MGSTNDLIWKEYLQFHMEDTEVCGTDNVPSNCIANADSCKISISGHDAEAAQIKAIRTGWIDCRSYEKYTTLSQILINATYLPEINGIKFTYETVDGERLEKTYSLKDLIDEGNEKFFANENEVSCNIPIIKVDLKKKYYVKI